MSENAKSFLPKSCIVWSRSSVLLALILFTACFIFPEGCRVKSETTSKDSLEHLSLMGAKAVKMVIVYDNYLHDKRLQTDWGFGCVIYIDEDAILFDTGSDGNVLLSNMKKMGIDLREINMIVLSHIHGDHVGGLHHFLRENSKVDVYVPASFPKSFNNSVRTTGAKLHLLSRATRLAEHVFGTGELNNIEQSLVLVTEKGLVVLTGCAGSVLKLGGNCARVRHSLSLGNSKKNQSQRLKGGHTHGERWQNQGRFVKRRVRV